MYNAKLWNEECEEKDPSLKEGSSYSGSIRDKGIVHTGTKSSGGRGPNGAIQKRLFYRRGRSTPERETPQ